MISKNSKIVVSIDNLDTQLAINLLAKGAEIIEVRLDKFTEFDISAISNFLSANTKLKTILTLRTIVEGGGFALGNDSYKNFILELTKLDTTYVDIEIAKSNEQLIKKMQLNATQLIGSYHNFSKTPALADIETIYKKSKSLGLHHFKVATYTKSLADLNILSQFLLSNLEQDSNISVIAMGNYAESFRYFGYCLGSEFNYTYDNTAVAPGQLSLSQVLQLNKIIGKKL